MNSSRRMFLKTTAGAGVAAALGTVTVAAEAAPRKWDMTTDVLIIGYGGAGAATAITAADNGANVLIIERQHQETMRSNTRK